MQNEIQTNENQTGDVETSRKLASIQEIAEVNVHPNADALELITVQGWQLVAKKGDFKAGDRCIFFEIDSVLPDRPEYAFMAARKFRVKTIKLRGEISQGLAMPVAYAGDMANADIDTDLTAHLGVRKYEPEVRDSMGGEAKGTFPSFIPKTDATRIQTIIKKVGEVFHGKMFGVTLKMDGTSSTFYLKKDIHVDGTEEFGVCSRNQLLRDPEETEHKKSNVYWSIAKNLDIKAKLASVPFNVAIQGEICGPRIQGNKLNLSGYELYVFDVFNIDTSEYLGFDDFRIFCKQYGFQTVPVITDLFVFDKDAHNIEYLLNMAKGNYDLTQNAREGLVFRTIKEERCPKIESGRSKFKVINNDYLLEEK